MNIHIPFLRSRKEILRTYSIGWIALIIMIASSSTYPAFAKQLTTVLAPLSLLFLSEVLTGAFTITSFGLFPLIKEVRALHRKDIAHIVVLGLLNGFIGPLLWFSGLTYTTAINGELFSRTELVFLMIFSLIFLKEKLNRTHLLAAMVIILGILTVSLKGFSGMDPIHAGDLLILASALTYSIGGIIIKRYLHGIPAQLLIFGRSLTAMIAFFMLSPFLNHTLGSDLLAFPLSLLWVLLAFGGISRFLSLMSFYEAVERLPITTISLFSTLSIVGSLTLAHLFLGEALHWYHILGCTMIILGALLLKLEGTHETEAVLETHLQVSQRNEM